MEFKYYNMICIQLPRVRRNHLKFNITHLKSFNRQSVVCFQRKYLKYTGETHARSRENKEGVKLTKGIAISIVQNFNGKCIHDVERKYSPIPKQRETNSSRSLCQIEKNKEEMKRQNNKNKTRKQ